MEMLIKVVGIITCLSLSLMFVIASINMYDITRKGRIEVKIAKRKYKRLKRLEKTDNTK